MIQIIRNQFQALWVATGTETLAEEEPQGQERVGEVMAKWRNRNERKKKCWSSVGMGMNWVNGGSWWFVVHETSQTTTYEQPWTLGFTELVHCSWTSLFSILAKTNLWEYLCGGGGGWTSLQLMAEPGSALWEAGERDGWADLHLIGAGWFSITFHYTPCCCSCRSLALWTKQTSINHGGSSVDWHHLSQNSVHNSVHACILGGDRHLASSVCE